jgi:hypothetical protein
MGKAGTAPQQAALASGGALGQAMRGQPIQQPAANSPIMGQQQLQDFLGGSQVSTGAAAQPMNNPFGVGGSIVPSAGTQGGVAAGGQVSQPGAPATPGTPPIPGNPDGLNWQRMRMGVYGRGGPVDTSMAGYQARTAQEQKDQVANDAAAAARPIDPAYAAAGGDAGAQAAASAAVTGQPLDPNSYWATHTAGGSAVAPNAWGSVYQRMASTPQGR